MLYYNIPLLFQLTPRSKIERWFSFVVPQTSTDEPDAEEEEYSADFTSLDKAVRNLRLSRRTLLSNKESGFVSETTNELNTETNKRPNKTRVKKAKQPTNPTRLSRNQNRTVRLSSTSSWLRRVLRLKRSQHQQQKRLDFWNNDAQSGSSRHNKRNASPGGGSLQRANSLKSRVSSL